MREWIRKLLAGGDREPDLFAELSEEGIAARVRSALAGRFSCPVGYAEACRRVANLIKNPRLAAAAWRDVADADLLQAEMPFEDTKPGSA